MDNKFSKRTTNHTGDVHFEIVSVVLGHRAAAGPLAPWSTGRASRATAICRRSAGPSAPSRRGAPRRGPSPADLSVGDPEDQGLRVKVGRPEGQQVFERRTSRRAPLAPEAWKVTSSHRRSAASERRSGPSRSTAQIATSTRPRLSAAWGVPRASAFSGFPWRCGRVSALGQPGQSLLAPGVGGDVLFAGAAVGVGDPGPGPGRPQAGGAPCTLHLQVRGPGRSRGPGAGRRRGDWPWFSPPAVTLPHGVLRPVCR